MNDFGMRNPDDAIARDRRHAHDDQPAGKPERHRPRRRRGGRLLALGGFLLLAGALSLGARGHLSQHQEVMAATREEINFVPSVRVAAVAPSPGTRSVTLPCTTSAFATASIFARATGYVGTRDVDIGDRVEAGKLLAQLAVPELDAQIWQNEATLEQLKSALAQAEANRKLAQVTWDRDRPLVQQGWATQQQGTVDVQNLTAQEANVASVGSSVKAQEQLLKALRQNRDYATIIAPFNGVITQRNIDIGSLVQGNATSGTFMFEIMQMDKIRVFVYVPQDAAIGVTPGIDAVVRVPELPDRAFPGTVTRIADALQSGTRTLLTEIDLPNPDGALSSGVYCSVELKIPRRTPSVVVPSEALIFNRDGMQVAVAGNGTAEIRRVNVTRDMGTGVEVDTGVKAGEQVILNPPVNLAEGSKVRLTQ